MNESLLLIERRFHMLQEISIQCFVKYDVKYYKKKLCFITAKLSFIPYKCNLLLSMSCNLVIT